MSIYDDGDDDDEVVGQALGVAGMAGAVASAIGGALGQSLEAVSYHVEITGGPNPDWHVRRVHFAEAISEPYDLSLDVLTADLDVEVDDLLGADVDLELGRASFVRHVHGVIERVELQGIQADRLGVRLHVAPAFKLLLQHVDTRIFQDKKVPQILEEMLTAGLGQYGRKVDVSRLNDTYLIRDYCVQYGESDFHFASRLMEEEGIAYIFEPELVDDEPTGVEVMVLVDQNPDAPNSDFPEIQGEILDQIPIIADRAELADCESLRYLDWVLPQSVTMVSTRRFNWKRPDPASPPVATQGQADARGRTREVYAPDDRRRIADLQGNDCYGGTEAEEDEVRLTRRRFQSAAGDRSHGQGASNVTCLRAGGLFTLGDHTHAALAFSQFLVTRALHYGDCPDREQSGSGGGERYQNSFECIPAQSFFRSPEVTPKPRVFGPQTATVTGPAGKEIHTDQHGRIKVRFHWDRLSPADETSSCWVRVAQMWAGKGWGTWFLPRIGMEVIVEFLDGNPDRPLAVGCVYNGSNDTPYRPDEQPTKSTIKSNSSIGGEGFNELRFEDAKGSEEIFVHAQKDYNQVVRSNRSLSVGGNETISVKGNETVTIKGAPVHGEAEAPRPGRQTNITGHDYLETSETINIKAPKCIVLQVGNSKIEMTPSSITVKAGNGAAVELSDMLLAYSVGNGSQIQLQSEMCPGITVESESEIIINGMMIYLN